MALTREQALAFVNDAVRSPKVRSHLDAAIGLGRVATPKDFDSQDADAVDRAEELVAYIGECCNCLMATLQDRPRQQEIPGVENKKAKKAAVTG